LIDVLLKICDKKRKHITKQKKNVSEATLLTKVSLNEPPRGFIKALKNAEKSDNFALIAEIKKASPSKGLIREDFDPASVARAYKAGGATCMSVLTDEPYFQGADAFLEQARAAVDLPAIRKDFMLDPYQIIEARAIGADCILIIMACLDDVQAAELKAAADELGMDALVEVHSPEEMERALNLSPDLLGINNRNLQTLEVDLTMTEILAPKAAEKALIVSESGLYSHTDLLRINAAGINCFLVGESLMREPNIEAATKRLLGLNANSRYESTQHAKR
jgi:indole-3-glycerol phosphate synthase